MTAYARDIERRMRRDSGLGDIVRDPKKKRNLRRRGLALDWLRMLWSKVVRMQWGDKCALAGVSIYGEPHVCQGPIEAHHFIHKALSMLLRFDPRNGIALCKLAHDQSGYGAVRAAIERLMDTEYLYARERILFADHLVQQGTTRGVWRIQTGAYLRRLLEEGEREGKA
jgi:hypothetical protein